MSNEEPHDGARPIRHEEHYLAGYLAGELTPTAQNEADRHLMGCETCWQEVQLARAGRAAATASIEPPPDELRRRLAAIFADQTFSRGLALSTPLALSTQPLPAEASTVDTPDRPRKVGRVLLPLAVATAVTAAFLGGWAISEQTQGPTAAEPSISASSPGPSASSPTPLTPTTVLTRAMRSYQDAQLPGTGVPQQPAPDLDSLGLHLMAASAGRLEGQSVTVFAYEGATIEGRVFVYLSPNQFDDAMPADGSTTSTREIESLTIFTDTIHPMLVIGADRALVTSVGNQLT